MTTPFRVLISDSMSSRAQEILSASPAVQCDVRAGISAEELAECIGEYNGLLVRSRTKVSAEILERAGKLKVIGRAGIGVDNIDVGVASARGILVENAPKGNIITTAEHAICLLLALVRNIPAGTSSMKDNRWEKKKLEGTEIYGKTFGVVGLGNIGRIVADLGSGLRMKVIACDPQIDKESADKLGVELFRHIEMRWNKGQFGKEWNECISLSEKTSWDRRLNLGREKIFQVRKIYNDITFIDEFFTLEFCVEQKFYSIGYNPRASSWEIMSRDFETVKQQLLNSLTNRGQPVIRVVDGNWNNTGELSLQHEHEGVDLDINHARDTLENLYKVWKRPVSIRTLVEEKARLLCFGEKGYSDRAAEE